MGGTAVDFGCGLGRMGHGLKSVGFERVFCVDQSPAMLKYAKESLTEFAGKGPVQPADMIKKIEFVRSGPDLTCNVKPGIANFVHSIITLQHMKPQLQVSYVEQFCDLLMPGAAPISKSPRAY